MVNKTIINEMGEKSPDKNYVCKVCKREITLNKVKEEEWYYCISEKEKIREKNIQFYSNDKVEYVCNEHYNTLSKKESTNYVEVGYPYYPSLLMNKQKISTF